ncbi:MAG: hypothetical protein WCJ85_11720 [Chitinophagaceae bacterium]
MAQPRKLSAANDGLAMKPIEQTIFYSLGDARIPIKILQFGKKKDIVYINVHDSEPTSVAAAKAILAFTGGTIIKLANKGKRNIKFHLKNKTYSFDANRIYSREGIEQTLRASGRISKMAIDEIEKFGKRILQLIPDSTTCIVSLHNNTNGDFSIKNYLPKGDRRIDAKAVYVDSLQDFDDITLTTDSILYLKMVENCYNSIWQDNANARRDGSLSVYFGERNRRYMNIETENGKLLLHIEMIKKLLQILEESNLTNINYSSTNTE